MDGQKTIAGMSIFIQHWQLCVAAQGQLRIEVGMWIFGRKNIYHKYANIK